MLFASMGKCAFIALFGGYAALSSANAGTLPNGLDQSSNLAVFDGPKVWVDRKNGDISGPGDILATVRGDWTGDGMDDYAVLTRSDSFMSANLTIYEGRPEGSTTKVAHLQDAFTSSGFADIEMRSDSSFAVIHGNINGRSYWQAKTVIAFRNGTYLISGYDRWGYDGMQPGNEDSCSWNILTRKVEITRGADTSHPVISTKTTPAWRGLLADFADLDDLVQSVCYR